MGDSIAQRIAEGFQKIEERRIMVKYVIIHPQDAEKIQSSLHYDDMDVIFGAQVIQKDLFKKGLILACTDLFEAEPPLNKHQLTEIIDISDLTI